MKNRLEQFTELFPHEPQYRLKQLEAAVFQPAWTNWNDVSALSKDIREKASAQIPFFTYRNAKVFESVKHDTHKALLELLDETKIETVLMENRRGEWTICVSSQVGCAMRCGFCATGKMGLKRNLNSDEIVDQYRFWKKFLADRPTLAQRISNIVFMGMGEPLANYENVKTAVNQILAHTDMGPTNITVSTVGILPVLEKTLTDKDWPHVRIAISLHSADPITRKQIVPTSFDDFLPKLDEWCRKYLKKFGNRRHHLTFEYVMLKGVNDTPAHAKKLAVFVNRIGKIKINLIPYNFTDMEYDRSTDETIEAFMQHLMKHHVLVTRRKTMGDDIAAACGQLIVEEKKSVIRNQ